MNLQKTGTLLKELRKEKGLTQEQLAEKMCVSSRTVSRWETGSNLPDLDVLIELSDFYNVDIRQIIDGERKSENMDMEMKDTLCKVADYAEEEKKQLSRKMCSMAGGALLLLCSSFLIETLDLGFRPQAVKNLSEFTQGLTAAVLFLNILYFNGFLLKIRTEKLRLLDAFKNRSAQK